MSTELSFALTRFIELMSLLVIFKLVDVACSIGLHIYSAFSTREAMSTIADALKMRRKKGGDGTQARIGF